MKLQNVIIVGSGLAGVASALGIIKNDIKPLILDVGKEADFQIKNIQNFYEKRKEENVFDLMIGENFEGLFNLIHKKSYPPKLTAPLTNYISKDSETLSPIIDKGFEVIQSFAKGGLASGWGAGTYEYNNEELKNLPINYKDLKPYYDILTKEIGVSGAHDDLASFFGNSDYLQKPIKISKKSKKLLSTYNKKRKEFNKKGVYLGFPRLAVLSEDHQDRLACNYSNMESWYPNLPYIYNPAFTLNNLIKDKKVRYESSILVTDWARDNENIIINAFDLSRDKKIIYYTKKLILAAGTVNTSKIVLKSKKDFNKKLNLIDNPLVQIPLIFPGFIGTKADKESFGMTNLNIIFDFKDMDLFLQGSIIELSSPARGAFYEMFPMSAKANIKMINKIAPSAMIMFLFFPTNEKDKGSIFLDKNNNITVETNPYNFNKKVIKRVISNLYRLKIITHSLLIQYPAPGHAIHYSGTLPMNQNPKGDYQCNINGELNNQPGIYIVDGSLFSSVAAKNISFTIMANAMRIGDAIFNKDFRK